jgi:hypothetical protein
MFEVNDVVTPLTTRVPFVAASVAVADVIAIEKVASFFATAVTPLSSETALNTFAMSEAEI